MNGSMENTTSRAGVVCIKTNGASLAIPGTGLMQMEPNGRKKAGSSMIKIIIIWIKMEKC